VLQDEGSTDIDWLADGTCVFRNLFVGWTSVDRKLLPPVCHYTSRMISDHMFQVDAKLALWNGQTMDKSLRFQVINPARIHNIDENYDAFRVDCKAAAPAAR
jgi:hypothetical protein